MKYPDYILKQVNNPIQYIGNEFNIVRKEINNKIRICLSFPDLYSIGMSSYGHKLLYHIFNRNFNVYAERVYAVEKDMETLLKNNNISLLSLETHTPIREFDFLGFTVEYELTYTNILQILKLSNIDILSKNRKEEDPIIGAGGTAVFNPLPISEFIDVFFIGDGEEMTDDITNILQKRKNKEISRYEALQLFDQLEYTYVPQLSGCNKEIKQIITDKLESAKLISKPLVPNTKVIHDRVVVELSRGCTRGCRFCQAGMIYRPVRQQSIDSIIDSAVKQIKATGYKDITLLSLSATDYTELDILLEALSKEMSKHKVSISLPSLRVGEIDDNLFKRISDVRKSSITIAIETVNEDMKKIINKNISKKEVYATIDRGINNGWKHFKLYFMLGLPYEEDAHIVETIEFLNELGFNFRNVKFHASFSPFVPRPFTPFQWSEQIDEKTLKNRIEILYNNIKAKNIEIDVRDSSISFLEGVFARGDKKLSDLIVKAFEKGARLDEWTEYFHLNAWLDSARELNIDLSNYLRKRELNEKLPWDFIHTKVAKGYYEREYLAAENKKYTEDCRIDKCTACFACDGSIAGEKKIKKNIEYKNTPTFIRRKKKKILNRTVKRTKIMMLYEIKKEFQYLSHLGIINLISTGLRRSGIDFVYTQGFNPKIKIVYGPPKPVGVYSKMEIMELFVDTKPEQNIIERINKVFPDSIEFYFIKEFVSDRMSAIKQINRINMIFQMKVNNSIKDNIQKFMENKEFIVKRIKNEKTAEINIRDFIHNVEINNDYLRIILNYNSNGSIKFEELYKNIIGIENIFHVDVYREKIYREENNIITEVRDL